MKNNNEEPKIDMLSQPLLTEEGFLNPACMSELEAAIKNSPKLYDRVADDGEWTKKRYTSKKHITSALAKWAVRQSPYPCPEELEIVVKYLDACLEKSVSWDKHGFVNLSLQEISKLLYKILYDDNFKPFYRWNESKNISEGIKYVSRYDGPENPDDVFIDLDALLNNVCLEIRDERRINDAFDKKFEEEHGKLEVE